MKNLMIILATVLLTVSFNNEIFAQGGKDNAPKTNWIDLDGDGICDNYTGTPKMNKGTVKLNFIDADGDGVCDNNSSGGSIIGAAPVDPTSNPNFIDADGDGVCDNYPGLKQQLQDGTGTGTKSAVRARGNK